MTTNTPISGLPIILGSQVDPVIDLLPVVDISEGLTKKITIGELMTLASSSGGVTIGTTTIAIGGTSLTLDGLSSISSAELTVSGGTFISRGITDNATSTALTIAAGGLATLTAGLTVTGAAFTSRGITDNATSTALTIGATGLVGIGGTSAANLHVKALAATYCAIRLENTNGGADVKVFDFLNNGNSITMRLLNDVMSAANTAYTLARTGYTIDYHSWHCASGSEMMRLATDGTTTLGGTSSAPAFKVVPVASQTAWVTVTGSNGGAPTIGTSGNNLAFASNTGTYSFTGATNTLVKATGTSGYGSFYANSSTGPAYYFLAVAATEVARIAADNTNTLYIGTGAGVFQARFNHTADATNQLTFTGSNGGNPTIGVTGGNLAISAATVLSSTLTLGGTVSGGGNQINNVIIGASTPLAGAFTTLSATGNATLGDAEATDTHAIKGETTLLANSASAALTVTQTGAGNAFVVEDSAGTDLTPFVIDSAGNVGIGGAPIANYLVDIQKSVTGATAMAATAVRGTIQSDVTGSYRGYYSAVGTAVAAFTCGAISHFRIEPATFGAGSTVTNQFGVEITSNLTGATNNYGFFSNIASAANRYSFYAAGTAPNYFAGVTTVAGATATPAGGSTSAVLLMGTTAGFGIYYGSGAPTVTAAAGSLYIRTDNAGASQRLYSNTTGSTTWVAITSL